MYEVGDKFIIEIDKIYANTTNHGCEKVYRIKGFNSLVFDEYGLDKLEKYDCNKEFTSGKSDGMEMCEKYYQQGLNDAWEAAKKISNFDLIENLNECFGTNFVAKVYENYTAAEAISKIKDYEEQKKTKKDIKVGDEVINKDRKGIVIDTFSLNFDNNKEQFVVVLFGAHVSSLCLKEVEKTGKHFDIPWIES